MSRVTVMAFLLLCFLQMPAQDLPFLSGVGRSLYQGRAHAVVCADSNYIFAGWSEISVPNRDISLVKVRPGGDTLWVKHWGTGGNDEVYSMIRENDGSLILAGYTDGAGSGANDFLLVKTDPNGNPLFSKTFGGVEDEVAWSVCRSYTYGGGFLLCGTTESFGAGNKDVYVVRTDLAGNTIWTRSYGNPYDDEGFDIAEGPSGEIVITGYSFLPPDSMNLMVFKLDSAGSQQWVKSIGDAFDDYGKALAIWPDGNILVAGHGKNGSTYQDGWLIKLAPDGTSLWKKYYGSPLYDSFYDVIITNDGGFCAVGYTSGYGAGGQDAFIVRTDANGDTLWSKAYGGPGCEEIYAVKETPGNGLVFAAYEQSFFGNTRVMLLLKTDSMGNGPGCHQYTATPPYGVAVPGDLFVAMNMTANQGTSGVVTLTSKRGNFLDRFCSPGGMGEPSGLSFNLFPNPAKDLVHLTFSDRSQDAIEVLLYDLLGCLLHQGKYRLTENTLLLNLPELESGIYFVTCRRGGHQTTLPLLITN